MESAEKRKLLQSIKNVSDAAKENKLLDDDLFETIDGDLHDLSRYFEVSKMQAFFLANVFVMNHNSEPESITTLFKYDRSAYWKLIRHIEIIYSTKILMKHISKDRYMIGFRKNQFVINEELRNQFSIICQCRNCKKHIPGCI